MGIIQKKLTFIKQVPNEIHTNTSINTNLPNKYSTDKNNKIIMNFIKRLFGIKDAKKKEEVKPKTRYSSLSTNYSSGYNYPLGESYFTPKNHYYDNSNDSIPSHHDFGGFGGGSFGGGGASGGWGDSDSPTNNSHSDWGSSDSISYDSGSSDYSSDSGSCDSSSSD